MRIISQKSTIFKKFLRIPLQFLGFNPQFVPFQVPKPKILYAVSSLTNQQNKIFF